MMCITILPANPGAPAGGYMAIAGKNHSLGKTAGQALDALTAQLDVAETGTVLVQNLQPDVYFNAQHLGRLQDLMSRWRTATDSNLPLPVEEQKELEGLIEEEVIAAGKRAAALLNHQAP